MIKVGVGKVAALITPGEIAINLGSGNALRQGDRAHVQEAVPVPDPDTGEELGRVLVRRLSLELFLVQERMSVGRITDRTIGGWTTITTPKTATLNPKEASEDTVLIHIGQQVTVMRDEEQGDEDDEPF